MTDDYDQEITTQHILAYLIGILSVGMGLYMWWNNALGGHGYKIILISLVATALMVADAEHNAWEENRDW